MNLQRYHRLKAEVTELDRMLADMSETDIIDRMSVQARIDDVEAELAAMGDSVKEPNRARLTFRGKPVVGSHGIYAEFGAACINTFACAVNSLAARMSDSPVPTGTEPNRGDSRLLITGTALGSFGFELEESRWEGVSPFDETSSVELAIEKVRILMEASLGSDDDLVEAASGVGKPVLGYLRDFLNIMADYGAVCALEFKEKTFRFKDVGDVRKSIERLKEYSIIEKEEKLSGVFQGVLPRRRTFEFRIADTGEIISGKVGGKIMDANVINEYIGKNVTITIHTTHVGVGIPRYILLEIIDEEK